MIAKSWLFHEAQRVVAARLPTHGWVVHAVIAGEWWV
jgi:hypothetical protein